MATKSLFLDIETEEEIDLLGPVFDLLKQYGLAKAKVLLNPESKYSLSIFVDNKEYAISYKPGKTILAWYSPFMPEPTFRTFTSLDDALYDLEQCLRFHNYFR